MPVKNKKQKNNGKINDLIFKELIKRGYSLEGNTRIWNIADSKLWYLTPEQAQAFLNLEKDKDYQRDVIEKEMDLINENISDLLRSIKGDEVNIIDLGCGDGKKAELFLKYLQGKVRVKYCPVDISSYMVEKALTRLKKMPAVEEVIEFQWNISDFENIENIADLLRQGEFKKNVILLLGNTLGNFEIHEILYEIRSAMKDKDILIIGNGLDNRHSEEILRSYNTAQVDEFLKHIPMQLGFERSELNFTSRFVNSRVELFYTVKQDKLIEFQGKRVLFGKGDQFLVAVSYKYHKDDFRSFLKMYFGDVQSHISQDGLYALALCKK